MTRYNICASDALVAAILPVEANSIQEARANGAEALRRAIEAMPSELVYAWLPTAKETSRPAPSSELPP